MSPASKSKTKEKSSGRVTKEQKTAVKAATVNGVGGVGTQANAYNPVSGTFHAIEVLSAISLPPHNSRFSTIDDPDDHSGSSFGTAADCDSASNNDSCSGDSEDQKDKGSTTSRAEAPLGSSTTGNEKREKIRQKNEKKHQRQKEKRAQDLHDRCTGYLMSFKLDVLSQQLVAMGFQSERATMALIVNEGRLEESVAWLFEAAEDAQTTNANQTTGGNLKIDIADELAHMTEMEVRFKCPRQDIERAVISSEGDLDKAAETIRSQKQDQLNNPKPDEHRDPPPISTPKQAAMTSPLVQKQILMKTAAAPPVQQRRDERDFNPTKLMADPNNRHMVALRRNQLKSEWAKVHAQQPAEKKLWPGNGAIPGSYSLATTMPGIPMASKSVQSEPRVVILGNGESKSMAVREPVIVMQRPQSANLKQQYQQLVASMGWNTNGISNMDHVKANGGGSGHALPVTTSTSNGGIHYPQQHQYLPFKASPVDTIGTSWNPTVTTSRGMGSTTADPSYAVNGAPGWNQSATSPTVPSSLGLYLGWGTSSASGSSASASPSADWNFNRSLEECDYTNIDWSLGPAPCGPWSARSSAGSNLQSFESWSSLGELKIRGGASSSFLPGLKDSGVTMDIPSSNQHEWAPFGGREIFSLNRFSVTPSL